MTDQDKLVILALADNRMNISDTARALSIHRNSVVYHIEKIKKEIGLDPRDFYDLCELLDMVRGD